MTQAETLVPVEAGGRTVYLAASGGVARPGAEVEIAARRPTLDGVLDGVKAFAQEAVEKLRDADVTRVTVEFGCEFAVESGTVVAVIGKAGTKSSIKVSLEWCKPDR